jgi:hypothetical protein
MLKSLVVLVAISLLMPASVSPAKLNPLSHCGTERWNTKTLDDPDANQVSTAAKSATIDSLVSLPVPSGYSANNDTHRYTPTEDNLYTVRAWLVGFKEEADRDLHVVIADPSLTSITKADLTPPKKGQVDNRPTGIMVAEIPDPQCASVIAGGHASQISHVRTSFKNCFGAPSMSFQQFSDRMIVDITGVGFFDKIHGQTGVARNGIELHPVLRIKTISGSCPTGYTATTGGGASQ